MTSVAHNFDEKQRTEDVQIQENVDFSAMLLSNKILTGLRKCGFKKPSPIQLKAIPMGRCGFDLIVKAKSGTGKTAVFGITALEMVNVECNNVQVLILAPTREIAVQIQHVIKNIGSELIGLSVQYFIGGTPVQDDEKKLERCHIAVGAPGRIKHLIDKQSLDVSHVKLFVLDEADKLLENSYQADINKIYHQLPFRKQVIAASATYPNNLDEFLSNYMISPMHVSPDAKVPCLLGLRQFFLPVRSSSNVVLQMKTKTEELIKILSNLSFNQCLIFSNYQSRAESLSNLLRQEGWPCLFISGGQDQKTRLQVFDSLRDFKCRILSSTDLTARGIDAANVDLVVNYDVPHDVESYLHRMGRAGRYGSYGMCISIASEGQEMTNLDRIIESLGPNVAVGKLPEKITSNLWECDVKMLPQLSTSKDERLYQNEKKKAEENDMNVNNVVTDEREDKTEQNEIDEDLFGKAIYQLTELLRLNKYDDQNGINNVATILKTLKLKKRLDRDTFLENFKNMSSTELLKNIENGSIASNENKRIKLDECHVSSREECQENKRRKLDENSESPGRLQRNVALFTITKCLSGHSESKEDCLKCINDLLELIKMEDENNKRNCNENLDDFKMNNLLSNKIGRNHHGDVNIFDTDKNKNTSLYQNKQSSSTNDKKNKQQKDSSVNQMNSENDEAAKNHSATAIGCKDLECIEDQVSMAYQYALSCGVTTHWNTMCEEHKNAIKIENESAAMEDTKENLYEMNEETENLYEIEENLYEMEEESENLYEMEENEHDKGLGEWMDIAENVLDNNKNQPTQQQSEIDEDLISDAYQKALRGDFPQISHIHTDDDNQPFGFVVDTSYAKKKFMNFTPTSTTSLEKTTDKTFEPVQAESTRVENVSLDYELNDFITRRNRYKQYFRHHGTVLRESASTFDSVENFQNWYRTWLQSLETLRHFVQQDVYEKEFRRKK